MIGQQMFSVKSWKGIHFLLFLSILNIILLIFKGPNIAAPVNLIGLIVSIVLYFQFKKNPLSRPPKRLAIYFFISFLLTALGGLILETLFLQPLSNEKLKIPSLALVLEDPDHSYTSRAPLGWESEMKINKQGTGFSLHPSSQQQYFGASEIQVFVRKNEVPIHDVTDFLFKMTEQLKISNRQSSNENIFDIHVETTTLLDGNAGIISEFTATKFWIPVRQVTVIGIKKKQNICTVSAIGLASHATLFRVICLGIHKTIRMKDQPYNLKKDLQFDLN